MQAIEKINTWKGLFLQDFKSLGSKLRYGSIKTFYAALLTDFAVKCSLNYADDLFETWDAGRWRAPISQLRLMPCRDLMSLWTLKNLTWLVCAWSSWAQQCTCIEGPYSKSVASLRFCWGMCCFSFFLCPLCIWPRGVRGHLQELEKISFRGFWRYQHTTLSSLPGNVTSTSTWVVLCVCTSIFLERRLVLPPLSQERTAQRKRRETSVRIKLSGVICRGDPWTEH